MYRKLGKRLLDISVSLPALILLFPVFALIAIGTWAAMGAPVFFVQQRPGRNAEAFRMIKFRTMSQKCSDNGVLLSDDARLTAWGRFLRSTSLDEVPELFNVLVGTMSLVGPRPLLMSYLSRYDDQQRRRHEITPGLTGWAQINGRNAVSWPERFAYDNWYVDHLSLKLDLLILWRTIGAVVHRRGIHASDAATMPEFRGNEQLR